MTYINRVLEKQLIESLEQFPAVVLTGPRQSGKSTILKQLFEKTHQYLTFDDPLIREQAIADPKLFLKTINKNVIFDEIQYVPSLLSYVKMEIDSSRQEKGRFIFTGSQQFQLIKDIGDSLAGRIAVFELMPFSLEETLQINYLNEYLKEPINNFCHHSLRGSYPELNINRKLNSNIWYSSYLQTYLERDVRTLYNIGNLRDFQLFIQLLASRCSQTLNLSSFSNDLGVSVNTLKKWISILEAGRIIYMLNPYYQNFGKRITKSPKIYFFDIGLVSYLTGISTKEQLLQGPMVGSLFENYCVLEVVKKFLNNGKRPKIYFLRTNNGLEVDLLIEQNNLNLLAVEIKSTATPKLSMTKNIKNIIELFPKLNFLESTILCQTNNTIQISENIKCMNINDFTNKLKV